MMNWFGSLLQTFKSNFQVSKDCKHYLIMTLLVKDEEDIIADNIDFHLAQGVDFFIVTDNLSKDRTTSILKEYENKGILKYILKEDDDFRQAEWVTDMARMAYDDYGAKWVINNDADEFWWPTSHASLREFFISVPKKYNVIRAQRYNFVTLEDSDEPYLSRMIYRERTSLNSLGRPLPAKICHRGSPNVVVAEGNHGVRRMWPKRVLKRGIEVLHYPMRNYRQFEKKIVSGAEAYERNTKTPKTTGLTWRMLYKDYYLNGRLPEYYRDMVYSAEDLDRSINEGKIIIDDRMVRFMRKIRENKENALRNSDQ